jgi:hypothetical protein
MWTLSIARIRGSINRNFFRPRIATAQRTLATNSLTFRPKRPKFLGYSAVSCLVTGRFPTKPPTEFFEDDLLNFQRRAAT